MRFWFYAKRSARVSMPVSEKDVLDGSSVNKHLSTAGRKSRSQYHPRERMG